MLSILQNSLKNFAFWDTQRSMLPKFSILYPEKQNFGLNFHFTRAKLNAESGVEAWPL